MLEMQVLLLALVLFGEVNLTSQFQDKPLLVYIDGVNGYNSHGCLNSSSPCRSLWYVSENLNQKYFVELEILSDTLNLTKSVNFTGYSNLSISGSNSSTALHCNETDVGLLFVRVENLSLSFLSIEKCGALRPSTSIDFQTQNKTRTLYLSVAVYILNCSDVSILNVHIVSSVGRGLSIYDTNGKVNITHCDFIENSVWNKTEPGGGGVYIEFTICSPGDVENCGTHNGLNTNSTYSIQHCSFINNSAYSPVQAHKFIPPSKHFLVPRLGKGGGLYLSIGSDALNNNFTLISCTFENNWSSYTAGGMIAEFLNSVQYTRVSIERTHFEGNRCTQTQFSSGGGLVIGFMFYTESVFHKQAQKNEFTCRFCTFEKNTANTGGGTGIFAAKGSNQYLTSTVSFVKCNWTENQSPFGAAVFSTPGIWDYTKEGFLPVPKFTDCKFESNSATQSLKSSMNESIGVDVESAGNGALFSSESNVAFEGSTHFGENRGSAVHLSNSVIEFRENSVVTFVNNTSHNGGAIAMYGSSTIQIENSSRFSFTKNRASSRGGALYFDFYAAARPAYHNCFITPRNFTKVNSTLIFNNNSADDSGDDIFTTTFQSCATLCSINISYNPEHIMQCIANFTFGKKNSSLSTSPEKFKLTGASPIKLIPGVEHTLRLSVTDEVNTKLNNVVYEASVPSPNVRIDEAFFQVSKNKIMLLGSNRSTVKLKLFTSDLTVSLKVSLTDCQPGYTYNPSTGKCECVASQYMGIDGCYPEVYLKQGYWMGYCSDNKSDLCTAYCPYGFCSYSNMNGSGAHHKLPNNSDSLNSDICGSSRKNRLCGECSPGHSIYHNSWKRKCGRENLCNLGWIFYIMTNIIPATLLFMFVIGLNISFTTGNANSFVLYSQILEIFVFEANNSLQFSTAAKWIQTVAIFPYNSFNMNFFATENLSFCLWKGASFMGSMMMNYLTVGFALALVMITIFATRFSVIRTKLLFRFHSRNSVLIHGLSAFFVLCYSQATRTTFYIINASCLYSANFSCSALVVNQAGHWTYLSKHHAPYAIVAFLVLLFMIIIPPVLLLTYPLMFQLLGRCKLSETKLAHILWRVMPIQFLDAFQSSFKDKYRCFAGLYFLYRAAFLALYACSWLEFYSIAQILLTIILTLHSLLQPYKERKHNIIDSLLLANLCLINAITLYSYSSTAFRYQLKVISTFAVIQAVLIILPMAAVIKIYCVYGWKQFIMKRKDEELLPSLRIDEETPLIH